MAVRRARAQAPKGRLKRGIQYLTREYDLYLMLIPMILFYILFSYSTAVGKVSTNLILLPESHIVLIKKAVILRKIIPASKIRRKSKEMIRQPTNSFVVNEIMFFTVKTSHMRSAYPMSSKTSKPTCNLGSTKIKNLQSY